MAETGKWREKGEQTDSSLTCLQVADGAADHEFGGQDALAEGHARMMQALEKHLHAGFADRFFVDADGRKRRGPHQGPLPGGENHPNRIHRALVWWPAPRAPKTAGAFYVFC